MVLAFSVYPHPLEMLWILGATHFSGSPQSVKRETSFNVPPNDIQINIVKIFLTGMNWKKIIQENLSRIFIQIDLLDCFLKVYRNYRHFSGIFKIWSGLRNNPT